MRRAQGQEFAFLLSLSGPTHRIQTLTVKQMIAPTFTLNCTEESFFFSRIATLHSYKLVAIVRLWFEFYDCLGGGEGNFMSVYFKSIEVSYKRIIKTLKPIHHHSELPELDNLVCSLNSKQDRFLYPKLHATVKKLKK